MRMARLVERTALEKMQVSRAVARLERDGLLPRREDPDDRRGWVLRLAPAGWVEVDALLAGLARTGRAIDRPMLERVVAENDKSRFELSADGLRVRAHQGHSIAVNLGLPDAEPPPVLWHGTASRYLAAILRQGLRPTARHAVHLSADPATARRVGVRHGVPVVLRVEAAAMRADGHRFQVSGNGVWLTAAVPARDLRREGDARL